MGRLFGTDGIRGIANRDLSVSLATQIGTALAMVLREQLDHKPRVFVGKDTRASSDMLEAALAAGLCAGGADAVSLGVVPTPAVAYLTTRYAMDSGVMISASHNPFHYNGIKIFGGKGYKLTDAQEQQMEEIILDHAVPPALAPARELGRHTHREDLVQDYVRYLAATVPGGVGELRVLVDCAHGSASTTARALFDLIGAQAEIVSASPNGLNINDNCGSTHVERLSRQVVEGGYHLGVAFDGDADRCLAVDDRGRVVNGDQLLAVFAMDLRQQDRLKKDTVVATVMSNLGFFQFAKRQGMDTRSTKVGDRYVLETMVREDLSIGGEQSGHIIFSDYMTTGDGQLSAIQLLGVMARSGQPLSQLTQVITILPQVLLNMEATVDMKAGLAESLELTQAVRRCEDQLGDAGRILIRPSGTEPLIRVMVEGEDQDQIEAIAQQVAAAIRENLG